MKSTVSRSKLKKIMKYHEPHIKVANKAEIGLFLDYIIFLRRLAAESRQNAAAEKSNTVQAQHIKASARKVLKSCRG